jgi:quinohemoprotein ethanol dehydrogenase
MILQATRIFGGMMDSKRLPAAMAALLLAAAGIAGCQRSGQAADDSSPGQVDAARLGAIAAEPGQWLTTGRDAGKTHYSPLQGINRDNVARVGFAWEYRPGTNRGMQATPIVVDGVMYTSGVAGRAYALDAATGALIWQFEPALELRNARASCCDIVNRGLAVWKGKVYVLRHRRAAGGRLRGGDRQRRCRV